MHKLQYTFVYHQHQHPHYYYYFCPGELRMGTDERTFTRILAHESFVQLRQIFEEYEKIAQKSIEQTLQDEMSGDLLDAMLAIGNKRIGP